jgi:hypothetical protein
VVAIHCVIQKVGPKALAVVGDHVMLRNLIQQEE